MHSSIKYIYEKGKTFTLIPNHHVYVSICINTHRKYIHSSCFYFLSFYFFVVAYPCLISHTIYVWSTWYEKPYAKEDFSLYAYTKLKTERTNSHHPARRPYETWNRGPFYSIIFSFISPIVNPLPTHAAHALVPFVCSFLYSSSIFLHLHYISISIQYLHIIITTHITKHTVTPCPTRRIVVR